MTLNITVASRWLTTQSSDFRLTALGVPCSDAAQKQVVLHYFNWSGVLCYCGIASYGRHNTADWLEDVLTHRQGERKPNEIVDLLAVEGSKWLRRIPVPERRHWFTLTTFEKRKPHVYTISNVEWSRGIPVPHHDRFAVSRVRPRGPRCFVTGWESSVTNQQRQSLESLLAANPRPESMRYAVARVNRDAAPRARETVSPSCVVAHLTPDGSGEAQVFGNLNVEFLPAMISHGINVAVHVPAALAAEEMASEPVRLVGVTWNSNTQGTAQVSAMMGAFRPLANQTDDGWPPDAENGT